MRIWRETRRMTKKRAAKKNKNLKLMARYSFISLKYGHLISLFIYLLINDKFRRIRSEKDCLRLWGTERARKIS
jgi:hypothetical protein